MANSSVYYVISCVFLHIFLSLAQKAYGKTCYGVYGCFDDPGEPEAPESPEKMKVRFQLSNRDIRTQVSCYGIDIEILPNKTNVEEFFNTNLPTKVIIPGWLQGGGVEWVRELIKALLAIEDSNVIFVNWRYGSLLVNYPQSKWNTKLLGRMIGEFFNRLSDNFDYDLNNVHIYGHSLGAHAAGIAGAWTNAQIGTITGLDPAGPLFHRAPPSERLDPSDAKFVLILHTDAGHYYETHLGISKSNGHVDLFPNGGNNQPGCEMSHRMINLANSYPGLNQVDNIFACSHQRAVDLLLESLTNRLCQFVAYKCSTYEDFEKDLCSTCEEDRSNCLTFGPQYFAEDKKPQQGSYFFKTDDTPLYCLREFNYQPKSEVQEELEITLAAPTTTTERPDSLESELEKEIIEDETKVEEEVDPEVESEVEEEIKVIEEPEKEGEENENVDENDDRDDDEKDDDDDNVKDDDDDVKDDDDDDDDDKDKKKKKRRKSFRRNRKSKKIFRDDLDNVGEEEEEIIKESILPVSASYWKRAPHARPYPYPFPIVVD